MLNVLIHFESDMSYTDKGAFSDKAGSQFPHRMRASQSCKNLSSNNLYKGRWICKKLSVAEGQGPLPRVLSGTLDSVAPNDLFHYRMLFTGHRAILFNKMVATRSQPHAEHHAHLLAWTISWNYLNFDRQVLQQCLLYRHEDWGFMICPWWLIRAHSQFGWPQSLHSLPLPYTASPGNLAPQAQVKWHESLDKVSEDPSEL